MKRVCVVCIAVTALICNNAQALTEHEIITTQANALGLEQLRQAAGEYAPELDWVSTPQFEKGFHSLLNKGLQSSEAIIKHALKSGITLLAIALLGAVAEGVLPQGEGKRIQVVPLASALAVTSVAVADTNALIGFGKQLIGEIDMFSTVLLPTMAAATAASGAPASAAAKQLAAMLFSDLLVSLIHRFLLPMLYGFVAASVAYAALGNKGLNRIASALKWVVTSILTAVLIAFVGYLSVSGIIAGTTDAITLKATKFTISSVVPVVGGILSDAAETVLAGACVLKNSVGVFGMLVVLGMCVIPFMQLGIHYLFYKMTAALCSTVAESRTGELIDRLSSAFSLVLGMSGACALLLLISIISAIRVSGL